jgi:hypothetical protein
MADMPSLIRLRLPTQVTGYTRLFPKYAASSCTTCPTYPKAVATASSVTSLWPGSDRGGAGSLLDMGIGSGTQRILKRRSDDDMRSIGHIVDSVDRRVVRTGPKRARSDVRRYLRKTS